MKAILDIILKFIKSLFAKEKKEPTPEVKPTYKGKILSTKDEPKLSGHFVYLDAEGYGTLQLWTYSRPDARFLPGAVVEVSGDIVELTRDVKAISIKTYTVITEAPKPKPETKPEKEDKYGGKPPGHYVGWSDPDKHPMNNWEPFSSGKLGVVESFLWKEESDNTHKPVVVVSCDLVPRGELHIEIYDAAGNRIDDILSHKSRGNPIHTYSRINFYLNKPKEYFSGPITVRFYQRINGKTYLNIKMRRGKDYGTEMVVENPSTRKDIR